MDIVHVVVGILITLFVLWILYMTIRAQQHYGKKNIYVLRTHLVNNTVLHRYDTLKNQLGADNVFMLIDVTKDEVMQDLVKSKVPYVHWKDRNNVSHPHVITVTEQDCLEMNSLHVNGVQSCEAHFVACKTALSCENYFYMWMIEYDVYCHGDWKNFMNRVNRIRADLLCKGFDDAFAEDIMTPYNNPQWYWWSSLTGSMTKVKLEDRRGCFFPVVRCSKVFLEVLENNLHINSGFCEVYFPTLCYINNLVLEAIPLSSFGIFRFKPVLDIKDIQKMPMNSKLYHPLK